MQKQLSFNQLDTLSVKNETVGGLALDFSSLQADGNTLAVLSDFNKVSIDVFLKRNGGTPFQIFNGYLEDYLLALYSQTPSYELWHQPYGKTHKVKIDFGGAIKLVGNDELVIRLRAQNTTFTSLSTSQSGLTIETIPAVGGDTPIYIVDEYGIPAGETNLTFNVGDNVVKVMAITDRTDNYFDSEEAKFDGIEITADGGFVKNVTQSLLEIENIDYFNNNPQSPVEDLVLFASPMAIHGVTVRGKLTKAALAESKIMTVRRVAV